MPDKAVRTSWCVNAVESNSNSSSMAHNIEQKLSGKVTLEWLVQIATENMRSHRKIKPGNTDMFRVWANVVEFYWLICLYTLKRCFFVLQATSLGDDGQWERTLSQTDSAFNFLKSEIGFFSPRVVHANACTRLSPCICTHKGKLRGLFLTYSKGKTLKM